MDRVYQILLQTDYIDKLVKIDELEQKRIYCKHGLAHALDVARAMKKRAKELGVDIKQDVIYAAALLHDIGRAVENSQNDHAKDGMEIALKMLQKSGYNSAETQKIAQAIGWHRQECGNNELAQILYFADKKTRPCYDCKASSSCKWEVSKRNKQVY